MRGNLIGKGDAVEYCQWWWDYYWSADDKRVKAEYSTEQSGVVKTVEYKYDLLGRRVARRLNGGAWRWYFYDGLKVVAEGSGTFDKSYYTLSPRAIGGIISRDNNGTKLFYHFDRLGNVMAVTDSNGRAYAVYTMEAFGNLLQVGTSNGYGYYSSQSDPQPYHLTTKEYDPDTGLYYFNARWYDSAGASFLSLDPSHSGAQRFVENAPTGLVDPTGEACRPVGGSDESSETSYLTGKKAMAWGLSSIVWGRGMSCACKWQPEGMASEQVTLKITQSVTKLLCSNEPLAGCDQEGKSWMEYQHTKCLDQVTGWIMTAWPVLTRHGETQTPGFVIITGNVRRCLCSPPAGGVKWPLEPVVKRLGCTQWVDRGPTLP